MRMEIKTIEFTVEDILNFHRGWITKLFVEEKKSEVEIVDVLYERCLIVSLAQIHRCLLDWGLVSSTLYGNHVISPPQGNHEDWEVIPSRASVIMAMEKLTIHAPSQSLDLREHYTTRPLPSIPASSVHSSLGTIKDNSPKRKAFNRASSSKLKLTYEQNMSKNDVKRTPDAFPSSTSSLEVFLNDQQAHERLAMGLDRVPRIFQNRANATSTSGVPKSKTSRRNEKDQHNKDKDKDNS